jgi:hypothetical protein
MAMNRRGPVSVLGWVAAIALVVATLLTIVLRFNLTGEPPLRAEGTDFVDFIVTRVAFDRERLPLDLGASLLFAIAFLALAGFGWLLGAVDQDADRGRVIAAAFVVAGVLGAAAQLIHVGAVTIASDPTICDCGYRSEEIIGRLQALHVADAQRTWLTHGAFVAGSVGFFLAAAPRWGSSWRSLSIAIGALLLLAVLVEIIGLETVPELIVLATVGLLIPAWAIVLGRRNLEAT